MMFQRQNRDSVPTDGPVYDAANWKKTGRTKKETHGALQKKAPPKRAPKMVLLFVPTVDPEPVPNECTIPKKKVTPTLPLHQTTVKAMQLQCGLSVHPLERANVRSVFRDQFRIQTPAPIDNVSSSSASEFRHAADTHAETTKDTYPAGRSDCNNCHYINTAAVTWLKTNTSTWVTAPSDKIQVCCNANRQQTCTCSKC